MLDAVKVILDSDLCSYRIQYLQFLYVSCPENLLWINYNLKYDMKSKMSQTSPLKFSPGGFRENVFWFYYIFLTFKDQQFF